MMLFIFFPAEDSPSSGIICYECQLVASLSSPSTPHGHSGAGRPAVPVCFPSRRLSKRLQLCSARHVLTPGPRRSEIRASGPFIVTDHVEEARSGTCPFFQQFLSFPLNPPRPAWPALQSIVMTFYPFPPRLRILRIRIVP